MPPGVCVATVWVTHRWSWIGAEGLYIDCALISDEAGTAHRALLRLASQDITRKPQNETIEKQLYETTNQGRGLVVAPLPLRGCGP